MIMMNKKKIDIKVDRQDDLRCELLMRWFREVVWGSLRTFEENDVKIVTLKNFGN